MNPSRDIVTKTAKCKRCNSTTVTWQQSERGKWYLTEVFDIDGAQRTHRLDFHSGYCGKPEDHKLKQAAIEADEATAQADREAAHREREAQRVEEQTEQLALYMLLSKPERDEHIAKLQHRLEILLTQNPSMDYMTEHMRWVAECQAARQEIAMFLDWEEELA